MIPDHLYKAKDVTGDCFFLPGFDGGDRDRRGNAVSMFNQ